MPLTTSDYQSAFIHEVRETEDNKYYIVVTAGTVKVFDRETGGEYTVEFPDGLDYLTSTKGFKAISIGGVTYLVNMDRIVGQTSEVAADQKYEAVFFVDQADYSTEYAITLDGRTTTITTADQTSGAASLSTRDVAFQLAQAMLNDSVLTTQFLIGSVGTTGAAFYIRRWDNRDFTISAQDGQDGKSIKVMKGSVQSFVDLTPEANDGMIIKITGTPESAIDDYWVQYNAGIWTEAAAPGTPIALAPSTMPWIISRGSNSVDSVATQTSIPVPSVHKNETVTATGGPAYTILQQDQDALTDMTLGGTLDGTTRTVKVAYDIDTRELNVGESFIIKVLLNNGTGFVEQTRTEYTAGVYQFGLTQQFTTTVSAGAVVRVQIAYGSNATPSVGSQGHMAVRRSDATPPGYTVTIANSVTIRFDPAAIYPAGSTVTITANSLPFTKTLSGTSADITGQDEADYFITAMAASFTVVDNSDGSFDISNTSGAPISWDVTKTATLSVLTLFNKDLALSAASLVGKTLVNETDGSSGTITGNSVHSITVGSLSGGTNNEIREGNLCHVPAGGIAFTVKMSTWGKRKAGDLTTCPMPSFVGHTIDEIFFAENRLGFTAGKSVVLSRAGDITNFTRQTSTELLASDPIDITSTHPNAAPFESAVEWNDLVLLCTSAGHQFALTGDPILSPQTVRMSHLSSFPMGTVRPVPMGRYLFFARPKTAHTEILQYFLTPNGKGSATALTEHVPQYIVGTPKFITGDAIQEFIAVVTAEATDTLWVYSYHYEEGQGDPYSFPEKTLSSWSKWTFPGAQICAASMLDGVLSLILTRSDGAYLEKIDLGNLPAATADHRDRQGFATPVSYTSTWQPSTLYLRDKQTDVAETRGRLQLRYVSISYHDATDFTVTVTPEGRPAKTYVFHSATPASGEFTVPVLTRNTYATVAITNDTTGGCAFTGLDWEGDYTTRAKRV